MFGGLFSLSGLFSIFLVQVFLASGPSFPGPSFPMSKVSPHLMPYCLKDKKEVMFGGLFSLSGLFSVFLVQVFLPSGPSFPGPSFPMSKVSPRLMPYCLKDKKGVCCLKNYE
jgi:hypothetical protein